MYVKSASIRVLFCIINSKNEVTFLQNLPVIDYIVSTPAIITNVAHAFDTPKSTIFNS